MLNKKIKVICDFFNIKYNEIAHIKPGNPYGKFIEKIDILFKKSNHKIIKAKMADGKFESDYFNHNYKIGRNQTWFYIYNGLFFLGLIKDRNYKNEKIAKGIEVLELTKYNSLKSYLKSNEAKDNILFNFKQESIWFKKIIIGSFFNFFIDTNTRTNWIKLDQLKKFKEKKYNTKYKGVFEHLYMVAKNTEISITENDKEKLEKFINNLATKSKKEINEALSKESDEVRIIEGLRRKFSKDLKQEFEDYEKSMLNVIDEYAKTFDTNIKMTKTDKAHIIPVWYLVQQKRWDDIANPNNGLILDPNTHRLFDKDKNTTLRGNKIYNDYHEFIIDEKFLNPERRAFINEWIEKEAILK
ncbi:HNH endonuclease [Mycoplasma todarodis]|uniref:HNH endonuclease signature motif containing protein n=1 Tax=Mycoplasma todarodis TaxID=1937191 RepID=UPI003B302EC8